MGKFYKSNATFANSWDIQGLAPLDIRTIVENKSDLTNPDTWKSIDGNVYSYKGMTVTVINENKIYIYNGASGSTTDVANINNWKAVSGDNNITEADIEQKVNDAVSALGTVYSFKGSKDIFNRLPTVNVKNGDVWNVESTGMNYAAVVTDGYKFTLDGTVHKITNGNITEGSIMVKGELSSSIPYEHYIANSRPEIINIDNVKYIATVRDGDSVNGKLYRNIENTDAFELVEGAIVEPTTIINWDALGATINLEWN